MRPITRRRITQSRTGLLRQLVRIMATTEVACFTAPAVTDVVVCDEDPAPANRGVRTRFAAIR